MTKTSEIIELLKSLNLWASKKFGQNFLVNRDILNAIIKTADLQKTDYVIEIGPGLGVLTQELAKKVAKVKTIELDIKLIDHLQKTLPQNVEIIHGDALLLCPEKINWSGIQNDVVQGNKELTTKPYAGIRRRGSYEVDAAIHVLNAAPYKVVANIPYNITSPLISHFLQSENPPKSMTLLVQHEVAEKIIEKEPNHTVLSLQTQLFATPKIIRQVSRHCFFPAPKITSVILHLKTIEKPPEKAEKIISLAKRAFSQKRKKLSNTLPELKETLKNLNLNNLRPQNLSIANWTSIVEKL
ncbi:ribosomal RNA small subunit methyltransferase A [Candidatus Peregrinibacteria bacterium]|nr:ribosomal RNA small subunit methyltransferase A [Candidatus Peregrinibacteria bacterium]